MNSFYNPPTDEEFKIAKEICEFLLYFEPHEIITELGIVWVDAGAEKEVYTSPELPGWVIKIGNESCFYEAQNYAQAKDAGLEEFFAPSYYIMKGVKEYDDEEHSMVITNYFTMQRYVICDSDLNTSKVDDFIEENYFTDEDRENIDSGIVEEYEVLEGYREDFADIENVDILIGFSDLDVRKKFEKFCDKLSINDIHTGNFGFCVEVGKNVIVDYGGYHNWEYFGKIA